MLDIKNFRKIPFLIYSLGLWGAQVVILFVYTLGFKDSSQSFTIPYRILVSIFSIYLLFSKSLFYVFAKSRILHLIFFFYLLILLRMFYDGFLGVNEMGLKPEVYIFRFLSFIVLPSFAFMYPLKKQDVIYAQKGVIFTCFSFLFIGFFLYRDQLGSDYRSAGYTAERVKDEFISPMAFAYIGFTLFGIVIWDYFYQKRLSLFIFLTLISISIFAIAWSGTRNTSLGVLFILAFVSLQKSKSKKHFFKILFIWISGFIGIAYLMAKSDLDILNRFTFLFDQIKSGDADAGSARLSIWGDGFNQFLQNPFFGDALEVKSYKYVAHNMYLETLMATGVLGGITFLIILVKTFKNGYIMLKTNSNLGWLMILFLERCFTGFLSTSILDPLFWLVVVAINSNKLKLRN
ncbi:O-antigen ligase family protein [Polaribacter sp. Hel1_85]|uniref:O-antigen ligase family protein n=1 Tax=Polaribacter sp. Hel1_85 TaxID=1250005 RepID=UPI00052E3254|nr:O-antigen ligase family protein [Polaribacter sp. Hel1_85]KGL64355.1 O-antigen liganse-like membrane protein [Polaribacter sp. Hel1_85]